MRPVVTSKNHVGTLIISARSPDREGIQMM